MGPWLGVHIFFHLVTRKNRLILAKYINSLNKSSPIIYHLQYQNTEFRHSDTSRFITGFTVYRKVVSNWFSIGEDSR